MNTLDFVVILVVCYILYIILSNKKTTTKEHFTVDYDDDKYLDDLFDAIHKNDDGTIDESEKSESEYDNINKYFNETQFNTDYRDTITAFNNIAPSQKQIFNNSDFPVKFVNPKVSEVKDLIRQFIRKVNLNVKNVVPETLTKNSGWDEYMPDQNVKSGWEKSQEALGLPTSIYTEPAKKGKVKLIKIDHIEKYATEEQIRYVTYLILQKVNVRDQMVVRVAFVLDNLIDERKFFDSESDGENKYENVSVRIEQIFVMGYLTDTSFGSKSKKDDFYNFEGIEKDGIMDQQEILKQLNQKYRARQKESNGFSVDIPNPITGTSPEVINELALHRLCERDD